MKEVRFKDQAYDGLRRTGGNVPQGQGVPERAGGGEKGSLRPNARCSTAGLGGTFSGGSEGKCPDRGAPNSNRGASQLHLSGQDHRGRSAGSGPTDVQALQQEMESVEFVLAGQRYLASEGQLYVLGKSGDGWCVWEGVDSHVYVVGVIRDGKRKRVLLEIEVDEGGVTYREAVGRTSARKFEKVSEAPAVSPRDSKGYPLGVSVQKGAERVTMPSSAGWQEGGGFWLPAPDFCPVSAEGRVPGICAMFGRSGCERQHEFVKRCLSSNTQAGLLILFSVSSLFLKPCGTGSFAVVLTDPCQRTAAELAVRLFYRPQAFARTEELRRLLEYLKDLPILIEAPEVAVTPTRSGGDEIVINGSLRLRLSAMRNVLFLCAGKERMFEQMKGRDGSAFVHLAPLVRIPVFPRQPVDAMDVLSLCVGCGLDYVRILSTGARLVDTWVAQGRSEAGVLLPDLRECGWIHAVTSALVFLEDFYKARFPDMREALRTLLQMGLSPAARFMLKLRSYIAREPLAVYDDQRPRPGVPADQVQVRLSGERCYVRWQLFKQLCAEAGATEDEVRKQLEAEGRVVKRNGRYQTVQRMTPKGPPVRCYCIKVPELRGAGTVPW